MASHHRKLNLHYAVTCDGHFWSSKYKKWYKHSNDDLISKNGGSSHRYFRTAQRAFNYAHDVSLKTGLEFILIRYNPHGYTSRIKGEGTWWVTTWIFGNRQNK